MIVRSRGGNVELRGYDSSVIPGGPGAGVIGSSSGIAVTQEQAIGVPAVLGVIELGAWPASALPLMVYRPVGDGSEKARDTPQWKLLHDEPNGQETTPQQLVWHILGSMLGYGGALLLKLKVKGKLVALVPQHPDRWTPVVKDGELQFKFWTGGGIKTLTRRDVIYIPGDLVLHPQIGVTPLTVAREAVAAARGRQVFETTYYATDGAPSDLITLQGNPQKTERSEFLEGWEARHQPGSRRTGLLWGGATYESIGVNLNDAQFAETERLTTTRVANIYGMPLGMLDPSNDANPDETNKRYRELFLQPRLTAIEQALRMDRDLFPDPDLFPKFQTNALLRPSLKDRADSYRLFRQGGIFDADELRALEDYPPHPSGLGGQLQATPVGGAPNPTLAPADGAAASDAAAAGY